jgi:hypothetical protein
MAELVDITIDDLTKGSVVNSEWQGTGVFDTLIAAVNKNIEIQYNKGRITGKDYAEAYVLALQTTLQQSVEFLLRRDLTEAQIADALAGIRLKEQQLAADRDKVEAELEKQWGYDVTRDPVTGALILGASTGGGDVDKSIELKEVQRQSAYVEMVGKDKEVAMVGLDTVMKQSEASKTTDPAFVYKPRYIKESL